MITDLLFEYCFAVLYRCFTRNYVMIFQTIVCIFSKSKKKWFSMSEDENRIDSWLSQPYFCLMGCFVSYIKAIRKASTHLTEEPDFFFILCRLINVFYNCKLWICLNHIYDFWIILLIFSLFSYLCSPFSFLKGGQTAWFDDKRWGESYNL